MHATPLQTHVDSRLQPPVVPGTHRLDTRAQETADEGASQGADEGGEGEEGEEDILPANVADEELENAEDDQAGRDWSARGERGMWSYRGKGLKGYVVL